MDRQAREDVVYEFVPEPTAPKTSPVAAQACRPHQASRDGVDERPGPNPRDAQSAFAKREALNSTGANIKPKSYETLGASPGVGVFEPPEQKLAKLQQELTELLKLAEGPTVMKDTTGKTGASLLGGNPADVTAELKSLEQRLIALARTSPPVWQQDGSRIGEGRPGPMAMPGSLTSQLEMFAAGVKGVPSPPVEADGRVTYEISYAPSTNSVADSSKLAALESTVADIEKHLGVQDSGCPFADLHTAVGHLQKRLSLLDASKLDAISHRVKAVMTDVDRMLEKKAELEGRGRDDDIDKKVNDLYEFCQRWSAASASLPVVVTRLRSLQALHKQSASFTGRLQSLEQQQDDLLRLLDTTSVAVHELGTSLQENMIIMKDNMSTLEEKVAKALKS
eukprot:TRINITY_DN68143_c0_g1_i1.p1 TRINITY_DN68143_c0_g1~~TRINITY_DN68143_c0_g1_i1.p1  ORF type:complete len:394 (+),score=59.03 TRINITY_DN68143_c0_g1_i1:132-1313(+)